MKNITFRAFIILSILASISNADAQTHNQNELTQQAKTKIQAFSKELKSTLKQAIKSGGLEAGIEVCQQKAPLIAQSMSTDGWTVSRTSLKIRNENNHPKPWQKEVLLEFEQRMQQGEPAKNLTYTQLDKTTFKLMKAIPTGPLCLSCHGSQISKPVKNKLNELYPNDKAVNFALKELRGAFVIEKQL